MTKQQKKNNFERIAPKKQGDVIRALASLQNLKNSSFYYYDWEDIEKLLKPIEAQLKATKEVLQGIRKGDFNLE